MSTEMGKGLPQKADHDTEQKDSSYAIPEDMSAAFHKLIADRLMKVNREASQLGADTGEEVGVDVGWQSMPSAARDFHARSVPSVNEEEDVPDCDTVVLDD